MWQIGLAALVLLSGCASTLPELRDSESLEQGGKVGDCENVSDDAVGIRRSSPYYHTTWRSAWAEGALAGLQEDIQGGGAVEEGFKAFARAFADPLPGEEGNVFQSEIFHARPFCRVFASDRKTIALLVKDVLGEMGNPIEISNVEDGIFTSRLTDRQHVGAKWKDGYAITVTEERTNRVVVRVLRRVYISRQGSAYYEGESDGQLEAWILMQVQNALTPRYR